MKKLMIALAVIAMAVSAQAISVDWLIWTNATIPNPEDPVMGTYSGPAVLSLWTKGESPEVFWSQDVAVDGGAFDNVFETIDSDKQALGGEYELRITAVSGEWQLNGSGTATIDDQYTGIGIFTSTSQFTWTQAPEPTSGLLLLLGVAGLALRRKSK